MSSPSGAKSRKVVHLEKIKIVIVDLKWIMRKAMYDLDRLSILPVS